AGVGELALSVECRKFTLTCRPVSFAMPVIPDTDASTPFDDAWRQAAGAGLEPDALARIERAVAWATPQFAGQHTVTGEPLARHAAGAVRILAGLQTDVAVRMAALLAALPADLSQPAPPLRNDPIAAEFGAEVARLVQGARALLRLGLVARHASDSEAD